MNYLALSSATINDVINAIVGLLTRVGGGIVNALKVIFQVCFLDGTFDATTGAFTPATDGGVSDLGYFIFMLLGISLAVGLTRWVTSLVRRKI